MDRFTLRERDPFIVSAVDQENGNIEMFGGTARARSVRVETALFFDGFQNVWDGESARELRPEDPIAVGADDFFQRRKRRDRDHPIDARVARRVLKRDAGTIRRPENIKRTSERTPRFQGVDQRDEVFRFSHAIREPGPGGLAMSSEIDEHTPVTFAATALGQLEEVSLLATDSMKEKERAPRRVALATLRHPAERLLLSGDWI